MGELCQRAGNAIDRQQSRPIIFCMSEKATERSGLETEIRRLEKQIDELLARLGALHEENRALRQRQDNLAGERASLMQRHEQVRTRVEAMIGRLKALENGT